MKILTILAGGLLLSLSAIAQDNYTLSSEKSTVVIKGTSSLHDWESNAEVISGKATVDFSEAGSFMGISSLTFMVDVESIKSGKGVMDKKTRGALDSKKHPQIIFLLGEVTDVTSDSLFATGELTIAGTTNSIEVAASYMLHEDGSLHIEGSEKLLMTDYGVSPPKAMLGTLKTGDEVEVVFNVTYQRN